MSWHGKVFQSRNLATQEVVWEGPSADGEDIDRAVAAAKKTDWALRPLQDRIGFLEAFRDLLKESNLEEAISIETGKPLWDSKTEVQAMVNKIALSIESYAVRCKDFEAPHPTARAVARHKPHGVVAVLGPFNFPGHLPNGHIVPALLAGNAVVFKPSEHTPRVGSLMAECWQRAGLPDGVFQLVQGGRETGEALALHPGIDGLFFTGSYPTGKWLSDHLKLTKILALELGGNNPLVVSQVGDLEAAAQVTIQSAYLTAGQRCTCARRLIVVGQQEAFLQELQQQIQRIRVGPYTEVPEPFMGPVLACAKLLEAEKSLIEKGGKPLVALRHREPQFLTPGLIDVADILERSDEEFFGPLLQLIRVETLSQAITEANHTQYGLTAGLLSDREEEYRQFYTQIQAGVINWNMPLTGASSALPFGGIKQSGNHRPSAYYAADYCSYPVATLESNRLNKIN